MSQSAGRKLVKARRRTVTNEEHRTLRYHRILIAQSLDLLPTFISLEMTFEFTMKAIKILDTIYYDAMLL